MRRSSPSLAAAWVTGLLTLALAPRTAAARDCSPPSRLSTCVDADTLLQHAGAARFIGVGGVDLLEPMQLGFGAMTSYQKRPIVLTFASPDPAGTKVYAVDDQTNTTFLWGFGLTRWLELDVAMPITLYQTGSGVSAYTNQNTAPLSRSVFRDPRIGVAFAILPHGRSPKEPVNPLAIAARFDLALPVGGTGQFAGSSTATAIPSISAEYRAGRIIAAAEVGARIRGTTQLSNARIGSQISAAVGAGFDILSRERLTAMLEANTLVGLVKQTDLTRDPSTGSVIESESSRAHAPAEWMASVRSAPLLGGDVSFHIGAGTGLPLTSTSVTEPLVRVVAGVRYAPLGRDADGDGIADRDDKCPNDPEDIDGFEDSDGCPDLDNDRDGIPDSRDKCRDTPEDVDGYKDDDGCPDLDEDNDGIPDVDDKCRNEPEDKDNFQDDDGCADLDNDGDGIPDKVDQCPNGPEDKDGFRDEDGCPDPDNDLDDIPDTVDQCPMEAEDKDGFEDEDGCPDPDNDHDGILDKADKCPLVAETINGIDDEDGCPETGAKDLVSIDKGRALLDTPFRFLPGQSKLDPNGEKALKMMAQKIRGLVKFDRVIVEAYADAQIANPRNEKLAGERADAVKAAFVAAGIPGDRITAAAGDPTEKRPPGAASIEVQVLVPKKKPVATTK